MITLITVTTIEFIDYVGRYTVTTVTLLMTINHYLYIIWKVDIYPFPIDLFHSIPINSSTTLFH